MPQVGAYLPVTFDKKMYIGKDLSAGDTTGNTGMRRAPKGSAGVSELSGADTRVTRRDEEVEMWIGFFAWQRRRYDGFFINYNHDI